MVSAGRNPQDEATVGGAVGRIRLEDTLAREEPEPELLAMHSTCACVSWPLSLLSISKMKQLE